MWVREFFDGRGLYYFLINKELFIILDFLRVVRFIYKVMWEVIEG